MSRIETNYATTMDKNNEVVYYAHDGEELAVETMNAYGKVFNNEQELMNSIMNKHGEYHHHPLTGPIYVKNCEDGDILKVSIKSIMLEEMGQSLSRSAGMIPITNGSIQDRSLIIGYLDDNFIKCSNGVIVRSRPMIGMIATNPLGEPIRTGHASKINGGNLDLPFIASGNSIYLPVTVKGGGLYLGDVHSLQGYGELSGIAMEASSDINIELEIIKNNTLNNIVIMGIEPNFEVPGIGVVGIGNKDDLKSAILDAYVGSIMVLSRLFPWLNERYIQELIGLIGQNLNGQAYAKTSESTTMIFFKKSDLEVIYKDELSFSDLEGIIFKGGKEYGKTTNKIRRLQR